MDDDKNIPKNFFPYITSFQHRLFFNFENNRSLEIISSEDAQFLYLEGRIDKFVFLDPSESEIRNFNETIKLAGNDLLVLSKT